MEKIFTPFTAEQVKTLENYQLDSKFHPYTCGGCESPRILHVTSGGLKCCFCGHDQKWAWEYKNNG